MEMDKIKDEREFFKTTLTLNKFHGDGIPPGYSLPPLSLLSSFLSLLLSPLTSPSSFPNSFSYRKYSFPFTFQLPQDLPSVFYDERRELDGAKIRAAIGRREGRRGKREKGEKGERSRETEKREGGSRGDVD
jgi:hypothetical protein